ncbi:MAG: sensor histidine kinase [Ignavibacteriae bacterium]|nr:MAG: sensor histidine kinase [Ignavibacteriota bacterium]
MRMPRISIFLKLILLILVSLMVLYISIPLVTRLASETRPRRLYPIYIRRIEQLATAQIGSPPDTVKARDLCEELGWNMRYQSHDYNWASNQNVPALEELSADPKFKEKFPVDEHFTMMYQDRPYSIVKDSKGVFIIEPINPRDFFSIEKALISILILVSLIVFLLYLILRWLFKPLKDLSAAVESIAEGKYDVDIPVKRKDELGELASSISNMSSRIKESITAKDHLLIDVSHELRSPLTRIKLGLEVGSSKEKINEDVQEMERMITGLLENYRSSSAFATLSHEKADLVKLVKEVIQDYNFDERIWFKIPEKSSVILNVDTEKIKIVIRNIIDNALKYSADKVEVNITEKKDIVELCVKDKGTGIPLEDQKFIFEPFYRSDRSRSRKTGGFGLGLSITKKIMDAHKGKINIESKAGAGTIVTLIFRK